MMSLDQRTIGDLFSEKLMQLPIREEKSLKKKCTYCGS